MPTPPGDRARGGGRGLVVNKRTSGNLKVGGCCASRSTSVEEVQSVAIDPVERKLAAIFAADIAGYSRLMGATRSARSPG